MLRGVLERYELFGTLPFSLGAGLGHRRQGRGQLTEHGPFQEVVAFEVGLEVVGVNHMLPEPFDFVDSPCFEQPYRFGTVVSYGWAANSAAVRLAQH